MKTMADASKLHDQALRSLALAAQTDNGSERQRLLTFVVAGGGYTGVESMAALRELLHTTIPPDSCRVE